MRRFFFLLAVITILGILPAPLAAAADDTEYRRPTVALLPVINTSYQKRTWYMVDMINEALRAKFSPSCLIIEGQVLEDALRRQGIDDWRAVDDYTLMNALRSFGADYSVRTEILPVPTRQKVSFPDVFLFMKTWSARVPVSFLVTNVNTGEVVFSQTYSESDRHESLIGFSDRHQAIRLALTKVLERFAQEPINLE